jgi:hypothetical protein
MDERMRFVVRLMEGEKMAVLCREFDISRKTGYKVFNRYKNSRIEIFDHETARVECAPNRFGANLLPMSPEENGYHLPG